MKYKKTILVFIISFALFGAGGVSAESAANATSSAAASTTPSVAAADTLPSAGLTPRSPFYFLDRFGDWVRLNLFTFNPVKKAEVRAEIADERLAELKEVASEDPQRTDIIGELEDAIAKRMDEVHSNLENFNAKNEKVGALLKKMENLSLNSQKVMENMLLGNVPEKIKDRTEKSLERIYKFAKKRQEIIMSQKERGLLSAAEAEKLMKERMERLKNQIERHAKRINKITNPIFRERFKEIMSKKLNVLEDDIFSTESGGEAEGIGGKIGNLRREAIKSILQARRRMMLRGATTTNEILNDIYNGKINFQERSGELIKKAKEMILEVEGKLGEIGSTTPTTAHSAKILLTVAKRHLAMAKKAFEAKKYREAFGRAISAVRSSQGAERVLKRRFEDVGERVDYMEQGERKEMRKKMKERFENRRKLFKKRMKEHRQEGEKDGENGEGVVCTQQYNPVCGADGITYPNRCIAEKQHGVDVRHRGRCSKNLKNKFNSWKNSRDAGDKSNPQIEE